MSSFGFLSSFLSLSAWPIIATSATTAAASNVQAGAAAVGRHGPDWAAAEAAAAVGQHVWWAGGWSATWRACRVPMIWVRLLFFLALVLPSSIRVAKSSIFSRAFFSAAVSRITTFGRSSILS